MRTLKQLQDAMLCTEEEAATCIRTRDALGAAAKLGEDALSVVEDYAVGICLALGTRPDGHYKLSPTTIFGVATMVIVLNDFGASLNQWSMDMSEQFGPLLRDMQFPTQWTTTPEDAWGKGYGGFKP